MRAEHEKGGGVTLVEIRWIKKKEIWLVYAFLDLFLFFGEEEGIGIG
jgi:hypothetical protein